MEIFICEYCGKLCKNKNSLKQHEIRCSQNPNRIQSNFSIWNNREDHVAWNKGLTKEDPRVAKQGESLKKKYASGEINHPWKGKHLPENMRKKYLWEESYF